MKILRQIRIVALLGVNLLLLTTLSIAQQPRVVNVLVLDFMNDHASDDTLTNYNIASNLRLELGEKEGVKILSSNDYQGVDVNNLTNPQVDQDLSGIDIIIYGRYLVEKRLIKIQPDFYTVKDKLFHRIGYSSGKTRYARTLTTVVADNLYSKIIELDPSIQRTVKTVAVFYDYEILSNRMHKSDAINRKAQEITHGIIVGIKDVENAAIIPWNDVKMVGSNKTFADVIPRVEADGYIHLHYGYSAERELLEVTPTFRTKKGYKLDLPKMRESYYLDFGFMNFVVNDLKAFLNTIITDQGKWDREYFKNISVEPDRLTGRARSYSVLKDYYFSNYYYYKALEALPELAIDIKLQLGFNKIYENRLNEAEEEFKYVLAKETDNSTALFGLSLFNYYRSDYNNAIINLEYSRANGFSDDFLWYSLAGYIYFDSGDFEKALDAFSNAFNSEQSNLSYNYVKLDKNTLSIKIGLCYLEMHDYEKATEHFTALFRRNPKNQDIKYYLSASISAKGIESYNKGAYQDAVNYFTNSRVYYKNGELNDLYRMSLIYTRNFDDAEKMISTEIELGNYDAENIYFTHGMDIRRYMIENKRATNASEFDPDLGKEAIKNLETDLEVNQEDPMTYYYLGNTYVLLDDLQEGERKLESAFKLEKSNHDIQLNLMRVYLISNQYDKCVSLYQQTDDINNKIKVPGRYRALMDFMMISAYLADGKKPTAGLERKLSKLLKKDIIIDYWSYDSYTNWLIKNCGCSPEVIQSLTVLRNAMQKRS